MHMKATTETKVRKSPARTTNRKIAYNLAKSGLPVFPCKSDKSPHKKTGFKAATTDKSTVGGTNTPTPCPVCRLARPLVWQFSILIGRTIKTASRRYRTRA